MATARKSKKRGDKEPHPVDVYVGKRLRARRILLNVSQGELGEKAGGITFQQVQKYELGTNRISVSRLYEFSQILNVSIEYFFEGYAGNGTSDSVQTPFDDDDDILTKRETIKLVRTYYGIEDTAIRKQVMKMAQTLLKLGA